jgi:formamidopyrimidine-DNA glycosylase
MPEGPEVRRQADTLHRALSKRVLTRVTARTRAAKAWLQENERAFEGLQVQSVRSRGKHLIGHVEGGLWFHSHLMMWGRWHVLTPPRSGRS